MKVTTIKSAVLAFTLVFAFLALVTFESQETQKAATLLGVVVGLSVANLFFSMVKHD